MSWSYEESSLDLYRVCSDFDSELLVSDFPQEDASWSNWPCFKATAILPKSSLHCGQFDSAFICEGIPLVPRYMFAVIIIREIIIVLSLPFSLFELFLFFIWQLEACAHPFFDELREPNARLPNGRPLPPLFNFKQEVHLLIYFFLFQFLFSPLLSLEAWKMHQVYLSSFCFFFSFSWVA